MDPTEDLDVAIVGNVHALCADGKPVTSFTVSASSEKTFAICEGFSGEFKYTAQVDGAGIEDPIIIVG
jgi:hypothetical protein